jgi:murein DD-endopeptidase MepM/ murein hydrolase activator NlpD
MAIDGMNLRNAAAVGLASLEHLLGLDDMKGEAAPLAAPHLQQPSTSYTVKRGDTLGEVAQENHTTVANLARINGITNPNRIKIGQHLKLTQAAPTSDSSHQNNSALVAGPEALKIADTARSGVLPKSQSKCYAYVKKALQRSGAVSDYMPGIAAKGAGPELEKRGF